MPAPSRNQAPKPVLRTAANPGELTFREIFTLIASEANLTREAMQPLREKFDAMAPQVEARIQDFEDRIADYESYALYSRKTLKVRR